MLRFRRVPIESQFWTALLCGVFFLLGCMWIPIGGTGLKVGHLAVPLLMLTSWAFFPSQNAKLLLRFADVVAILGIWTLVLLVSRFTGDTAWGLFDILKLPIYTMFAFSGAAVLIKMYKLEGQIFPPAIVLASAIAGAAFAVFFLSGLSPLAFGRILVAGLVSGNPDFLIFSVFGSSGVFNQEGVQFIAGMRHTMSSLLVVCIVLGLAGLQSGRNTFQTFVVLALLAFIIIALQSRSAWLALSLGVATYLFTSIARKPTWQSVLVALSTVAASGVLLLRFGSILTSRLSQSESVDGRVESLDRSVSLIVANFPFPVEPSFVHGSPHNFVLDSALSGGAFAGALALALFVAFLGKSVRYSRISQNWILLAAVLPLLVRFLTAGGGVPGPAPFFGLAFVFAVPFLATSKRAAGDTSEGEWVPRQTSSGSLATLTMSGRPT